MKSEAIFTTKAVYLSEAMRHHIIQNNNIKKAKNTYWDFKAQEQGNIQKLLQTPAMQNMYKPVTYLLHLHSLQTCSENAK